MKCKHCEGKGWNIGRKERMNGLFYLGQKECICCKGSGEMNDNYPPGFNGIEGEDENEYLFFIQGEPNEVSYTEEEALEQLRGRTVGELIDDGMLHIE